MVEKDDLIIDDSVWFNFLEKINAENNKNISKIITEIKKNS